MSNNINFLDLIKQKDRQTEFENQRKKQQQEQQQQQNLKKCSECFKPNYELNNKNICGSCNDIKDNSKNFRDKVHSFNNQQEYLEMKKRSSQDSQNSSNHQLNKKNNLINLMNNNNSNLQGYNENTFQQKRSTDMPSYQNRDNNNQKLQNQFRNTEITNLQNSGQNSNHFKQKFQPVNPMEDIGQKQNNQCQNIQQQDSIIHRNTNNINKQAQKQQFQQSNQSGDVNNNSNYDPMKQFTKKKQYQSKNKQDRKEMVQRNKARIFKLKDNIPNYFYEETMEDKKKMNRIIFILILILLVLTWLFLKIYNLQAIQFCDSGINPSQTNNCKPCPKNGLCENGQLTCDVMYVRDGDNCIESQKLLQLKDKTLEGIIEDLERNNGDLQCSQLSNDNQIAYKSIKEIKLILDKIPQLSLTLIQDLKNTENQKRFDYKISENGMIYTKNSRKSLICHIKIYFYQNPFRSFGLTIFTIISILTMYKIRRIQIERKISYEIFDFLVTDLKKSQDNTLNIAKYDYEWKKKYKSDFNENVLHNVEKLRQQVKQIEVFFDENDTLWYLNKDVGVY